MKIGKPVSEPHIESAPITAPKFRPHRPKRVDDTIRPYPERDVEESVEIPERARQPVPVRVR